MILFFSFNFTDSTCLHEHIMYCFYVYITPLTFDLRCNDVIRCYDLESGIMNHIIIDTRYKYNAYARCHSQYLKSTNNNNGKLNGSFVFC